MLERVAIIGSGNWGSAIAKVVGQTVANNKQLFHATINMWVYEETLPDGRLLSAVINETRENVKYLPGHRLPENIVAVTDLVSAVEDATILVFVLPHQFIHKTCATIRGRVNKECRAVSLVKGVDAGAGPDKQTSLKTVSSIITEQMEWRREQVAVLMGANIADEVARGEFCEATIGCVDGDFGETLRRLFELPHFRIQLSSDVVGVEMCGALKNVVAVAAGIIDGLRLGANTKAAVIRIGLLEMSRVISMLTNNCHPGTMFESCGVADLITTCYGGRNRKIGQALAEVGPHQDTIVDVLEARLLNGQKVQGPPVAREIAKMARARGMEESLQLMMAVNAVCYEGAPAQHIISVLESYKYHH